MKYTVQLDNGDRHEYEAASVFLAYEQHTETGDDSPIRYVVSENTAIHYFNSDPKGEWSGIAYPSS